MIDEDRYFLGYFSDDGPIAVRNLSEAEYNEAVAAIDTTNDLWADYQLLTICRVNLQLYNQELEALSSYCQEVETIARSRYLGFVFNLNRHLIDFLNSFRMFLDHLRYKIVHRDGDPSPALEAFNESTKRQFDNVFAYRFLYKLRDYSQHCDLPIHITTVTMYIPGDSRSDTTGITDDQRPKILLVRDKLLTDFDKWGAVVVKEIPDLPERVEIDRYLLATLGSLDVIFREYACERWPSIIERFRLVRGLSEESGFELGIYSPGSRPLASEYDYDWDRLPLPVHELSTILE